jgi:hypothetical protein
MAQVVKWLTVKHKVLSSISGTEKKKSIISFNKLIKPQEIFYLSQNVFCFFIMVYSLEINVYK